LSGALNQGKKHEKYDSRQQTVNNEGRHADPFQQADGYLDTGMHAESRDRRTARQGDQVRVQAGPDQLTKLSLAASTSRVSVRVSFSCPEHV